MESVDSFVTPCGLSARSTSVWSGFDMLPIIVNSNTPYGILNAQARSHSALEANQPFAAKIGAVIATFAFIERDMPMIISRLTGMDPGQAFAVAGVFRAFSNRIDMFAELIKLMNDDQVEKEIGSHFKGHLSRANVIRNKYAHASYMGEKDPMTIVPFSGDFNRPARAQKVSLADIEKDLDELRAISAEIFAFTRELRLTAKLHARLSRKFPSANWG